MQKLPTPQPIDDFAGWLNAFTQPSVLTELALLCGCVLLTWLVVHILRKGAREDSAGLIWLGRNHVDGVLFPLMLLCLVFVVREVLLQHMQVALLKLAIPVLVALLVIRVGVKVLQATFRAAKWLRSLEHSISWLAWGVMVLWVSGLLPIILNELDDISWKMGSARLSLRNLLEGIVTGAVVLLITLWISAGIESRLLKNATGNELSVRKAVSNAVSALLMSVGLILALSTVGIDLTALSVLGGAVGVGIGLGLQKLAANYVSGFVILAERSMRIGDSVRVDNFEGTITKINARYSIIRSLDGSESIVPNEMLITRRVENLSLADSRLHQRATVTLGFDCDVTLVRQLLLQAAMRQPRVLAEPAPGVTLESFAAQGLEFSVGYWISDPENGLGNVRSDILLDILAALRAHGIPIANPANPQQPILSS
ncbi:MAG: mechanosensitive ion channel [Rhodoferax sp.]|nr:mechanosensitive ion channel [Rhodoferax sp.]